MSQDKSEFVTAFEASLSNEDKGIFQKFKAAIKGFKAGFDAVPAPTPAPNPTPAPASVALEKVMTSTDGKTFSIASEMPAVDVAIMETTSGTPTPFDGMAEFEDGSKITAVAGTITEYTPAPAPAAPVDQAAAVQQATATLRAEFASQKVSLAKEIETKFAAKFADIEKENADLKGMVKTVVEFFAFQMETPAAKPATKTQFKELTAEEVAKLSPADQVKYNRGKL
jgi:hypothetical protein